MIARNRSVRWDACRRTVFGEIETADSRLEECLLLYNLLNRPLNWSLLNGRSYWIRCSWIGVHWIGKHATVFRVVVKLYSHCLKLLYWFWDAASAGWKAKAYSTWVPPVWQEERKRRMLELTSCLGCPILSFCYCIPDSATENQFFPVIVISPQTFSTSRIKLTTNSEFLV